MRIFRSALVVVLVTAGTAAVLAQNHSLQSLASATWGPAPPMLPPGAQIAVLSGDPGKPAPFTVRLKFPANYAIPAHSHPTDENIVVVSGAFFMGMGTKLDKTAGTALAPGGFTTLPAGMNHYAYTKVETTVVLFGTGPVDLKYVNPQDDPRNAKK